MKCIKCGEELGDNDLFCLNCGAPVQRKIINDEEKNENNSKLYIPNNQNKEKNNNKNISINIKDNIPQKKGINFFTIILFIFIILIISLVLYFTFPKLIKKYESYKNNTLIKNETNLNVTNNSNVTIDSNNNHGSNVQLINSEKINNIQTYKVKHNGFDLFIPSNIIYEINYVGDSIIISDENRSWTANIYIEGLSYEKVRENRDSFPHIFNEFYNTYNLKMATPIVEISNGIEYLIIEGNIVDTNMMIGMAKLDSNNSVCFEVFTQNNDYNRDYLENISFIISNAKYTGNTGNIARYLKTDEIINMKEIIEKLKEDLD